jgi:DNA-binding Lrp family transcriptional regulator
MFTAFVLVKLAAGREKDVHNALMKLSEIQGIRPVFGDYDIIARIETADFRNIRDIVMNKIRRIDGVMSTTTLIGVEEN